MSGASETTALTVSIPFVSSASPTKIMEKEKSDNSEMFQGNAEKKPAWNMLSNGDPGIKPVMEASSWPLLSQTAKTALCSNKSSTDSLKSLGCDGSSSYVSSFSKGSSSPAEQERREQTFNKAQSSSGHLLSPDTSASAHNQGKEFASQSHVSTHNQNISHHPHQSQGGRRNQEQFSGQSGLSQPPRGGTPTFVRPSPPPPLVPSLYAQYMSAQQSFNHIAFTDLPPPMMYHPYRLPFMEPPPLLFRSQNRHGMHFIKPPHVSVPSQKDALKSKIPDQVQEVPLKTRILNQVQYYFSEDNLPNDVYLRKRMNDEGFVHIELIAGFNKLKALTSNIQLILDSLQGSNIVEVKDYQIRNRSVWRKYVMPRDWRVTFYLSQEYAVANDNHQNMQLEQKPEEVGSSSQYRP